MRSRTRRRLIVAAALAAIGTVAVAQAGAAPSPTERYAVVTLDGGRAAVYTGPALAGRIVLRGGDRAELSPDARLVAYTRLVDGRTELRVAETTSGADRLVTRLRPYDIALAFSPDGRRLAYSSAAGIATVSASGGGRRQVHVPAAWRGSRYSYLAFAPDGRRLFVSRTTGDGRKGTLRNELAVVELATGRGTTLYRSPNAYDQQARPHSIAPDGGTVAVDGTGAVLLVRPGGPRPLVPRPAHGIDAMPLFSSDGRRIAFTRIPTHGVGDVYVADADGGNLRRLTTTPIPPRGTPKVGTSALAWSPDGTRLLTFRHDRFAVVHVETRASTALRRVGVSYAVVSARWVGKSHVAN